MSVIVQIAVGRDICGGQVSCGCVRNNRATSSTAGMPLEVDSGRPCLPFCRLQWEGVSAVARFVALPLPCFAVEATAAPGRPSGKSVIQPSSEECTM
jgi:hypothetical protein